MNAGPDTLLHLSELKAGPVPLHVISLPEPETAAEPASLRRLTAAVSGLARAAELVVFGMGSTGAGNDLAGATDLATKMVREFGMSAVLGPVGYPEGGSVFLGGGGGPGLSSRPYAEATQAAIDGEVSKLLRQAEERAVELLRTHRPELDALVDLLLMRETVDGSDVYRLTGREDRSASPSPPSVVLAPHPAGPEVTSADGSTPVP